MPLLRRPIRLSIVLLPLLAGCGQQFGALVYHLGLIPPLKVEAEFTLTKGPLLILVEDDYELTPSPGVRDAITVGLAKQFAEHRINRRVVPLERLKRVRAADPDYEKIPADKLGRMVEAEQVLWVKIVEYCSGATEEVDNTNEAAKLTVTLRVLNTHAEVRDDVRLWPEGREPHRVTSSASLGKVQRFGEDNMQALLIEDICDSVAKLFYDHTVQRE
jgi:hypothetical protein